MLSGFIKQFTGKGEVYLRIKARPGAALSQVKEILQGEEGETIKIDVAAPAVSGKANYELIKFLAREFGANKAKVKIISGAGERVKLVKILK
jgi:uncharacterized protein